MWKYFYTNRMPISTLWKLLASALLWSSLHIIPPSSHFSYQSSELTFNCQAREIRILNGLFCSSYLYPSPKCKALLNPPFNVSDFSDSLSHIWLSLLEIIFTFFRSEGTYCSYSSYLPPKYPITGWSWRWYYYKIHLSH